MSILMSRNICWSSGRFASGLHQYVRRARENVPLAHPNRGALSCNPASPFLRSSIACLTSVRSPANIGNGPPSIPADLSCLQKSRTAQALLRSIESIFHTLVTSFMVPSAEVSCIIMTQRSRPLTLAADRRARYDEKRVAKSSCSSPAVSDSVLLTRSL